MHTEWTNLKVCLPCMDPRPPQMTPPNVYPEGIPVFDARAPQDLPDRLTDDTSLQPTIGGIEATVGQYAYQNGQQLPDGAISPQDVLENPLPEPSPNVLQDDITIRTGPISPPTAS